MLVNPYRNRGPLRRHDEFFGRRQELSEIYRAVAQGHYVSLVGERRVGKTSILNALGFEEFRRYFGVPTHLRFVSLNSQYCTTGDESAFIQLLVSQIGRATGTKTRGTSPEALRRVAREIEDMVPRYQVIILLDEVDVLVHNRNISPELFAYLRAWTEEFQIPFVVASKEGSVDLFLDAESSGSPFWNLFQLLYVGPMSPTEADELVRVPAERCKRAFNEPEVERVLLLGGHQPYFLQLAADCMFDAKLKSNDRVDFDTVMQDFRFKADAHLEYLVGHIPTSEREALVAFVQHGTRPEPKALSGLLKKGVLLEEHGTLRPFSQALADVVRAAEVAAVPGGTFFQRAAYFFRD